MDQPGAGRLLVASPVLVDPNFHRTVVLILEHGPEGAVGVVLNRPSEAPIEDHLPAFAPRAATPPVVFVGGPVEPAVAIGLERADRPDRSPPLPGVSLLDLEEAPEGDADVRIYSGYAGWGAGQLEDELAEGAWIVVDALPDDVFAASPEALWHAVLRRQPGPVRLLATYPPDPTLN